MARSRTPKRPPKEDAPAPAPVAEPEVAPARDVEPRMGVAEYTASTRLPPMHAAILKALHATTKATRSEWATLLHRALHRPVP